MKALRLAFMAVIAAPLTVVTPTTASAADQEVRQFKSKDTADVASGKAYIVYDTLENKFDIFFLRSLTEDELVQFNENRKFALAEERAKQRKKRDGAPGVTDEELVPDAGFTYVDPDIRNLVRLDSGRVFEKAGKTRTYVVEVPPGEYTVFGAGIDGLTGGTCMCMGSVRFDARSGEITDLGSVLVALEDGKTEIPELAPYEAPEFIRRKTATYIMSVRPATENDPVPAKFADLPVVPAQYRASGKFPNFLGMIVNRMPTIPGVLEYDLDKVIDVQAELARKQAEEARAAAEEAVRLAAEDAAQAEADRLAAEAKTGAFEGGEDAVIDPVDEASDD